MLKRSSECTASSPGRRWIGCELDPDYVIGSRFRFDKPSDEGKPRNGKPKVKRNQGDDRAKDDEVARREEAAGLGNDDDGPNDLGGNIDVKMPSVHPNPTPLAPDPGVPA